MCLSPAHEALLSIYSRFLVSEVRYDPELEGATRPCLYLQAKGERYEVLYLCSVNRNFN
jgi:hypothetical protein